MKKIIITGVAGYIGGHLAHFFLKKKYYVLGIDNFYSGEKKLIKSLNKFKNFNFINLDISKKKIQNIKGCYDCIIHLAAQTSVQKSIKNKKETFRINQMTLKNALKIADVTKCKLFFFTSSAAVYGNVKKIPINEKENLKPTNAYGLSKKLNEQQINKFSRKKKIKFVILRLFNIYGKSISNTRNFGVINKYIESIKKKKIIYLHHQGTCTRDFFYIKDLIQVFYLFLKFKFSNKINIFNVGSGKNISVKEILNYITNYYKSKKKIKKIKILYTKLPKGQIIHSLSNNLKLKKNLQLSFTKIENGLDNYLSFLEKNY